MKRYQWIAGLVLLLFCLTACKAPDDGNGMDAAGFSDAAAGDTEGAFLPETEETEEIEEDSAPIEETTPEEDVSSSEEPVAIDGVVRIRTLRNYQDRYFEIENASDGLSAAVRAQAVNASSLDHPSTEYLPLLRFDTADALVRFINGQSQEDMVSFEKETAEYDEAFFEENALFAVYLSLPEKCGPLQVHYISATVPNFTIHIGIAERKTSDNEGAKKEAFVLVEIPKTALEGYNTFTALRDDRAFSMAEWPTLYRLGVSRISRIEDKVIYMVPLTDEAQTEHGFEALDAFDFQVGDTVQLVHTGADESGDIPKGYGLGMKRAETPNT